MGVGDLDDYTIEGVSINTKEAQEFLKRLELLRKIADEIISEMDKELTNSVNDRWFDDVEKEYIKKKIMKAMLKYEEKRSKV